MIAAFLHFGESDLPTHDNFLQERAAKEICLQKFLQLGLRPHNAAHREDRFAVFAHLGKRPIFSVSSRVKNSLGGK